MSILIFTLGAFVGSTLTFMIFAVLNVAHRADENAERIMK